MADNEQTIGSTQESSGAGNSKQSDEKVRNGEMYSLHMKGPDPDDIAERLGMQVITTKLQH